MARAPGASNAPLPSPIDAVGADLGEAFGGYNVLFYAGAVGGSAALAFSDSDRSIRDAVQAHIGSRVYGNTANLTGYILPVASAGAVWLMGLAVGDRKATGAGSAAVQALVVTAALSGYYGADELWIPFVGYPLDLAIAIGMLSGDQHWTSDLLAGAVIGQCVGWSIGTAFRARERGQAAARVSLAPLVAPSSRGAAIEATW